jgi:hypothetical protein
MMTPTSFFSILLSIVLFSCNFNNNESAKQQRTQEMANIQTNWKNRIVDPTTNSEKATNLWLDLETYTKYYKEKDVHGFIDMTIPRFKEYVGDSIIYSATEKDFEEGDDYDYVSIKHKLEEGVFHTTENSIIASVLQTREFIAINSIKRNNYNYTDEIVAVSIDNGVNWQFAIFYHIKHIGIESFFPNEDCDLILKYLEEDKRGKVMTTKGITFQTN